MTRTRDKQVLYIIGALFIALVPDIGRLPVWVTMWCVLLWGYMAASSSGIGPWPNRWVRYILTGLGIAGVIIFSKGHDEGNAYLGLLAIMATLKPLEIRSYRDKMVSLFIAYFIVITSLFESESLTVTLYMFLSVFFTTGVMIHVNQPHGRLRRQLGLAGKIMFQAFPAVIVLFFLFPRVQGALWGVTRQKTARTGFSENMSPGDISRLVKSTETAFIVRFAEEMPENRDLYFRGVVLWHYDGRTWSPLKDVRVDRYKPVGDNLVDYYITLEPHGERWLFAIDLPLKNYGKGIITEDHTLRLRWRLTRKIRYQAASIIGNTIVNEKNRRRNIALKIPETGNPRSRKLAMAWRKSWKNPEDIVDNGLRFFKDNGFEYTLEPPELTGDIQDDFLFRSRKGYCEHYASAYAFLMRAAGIPSRVVVGYHGGHVNPYSGYLVVRQSEAHAWVEVFLARKGWVRVDPTAAVAPGRIDVGLEGALQREALPDYLSTDNRFTSLRFKLKLGWDALNSQWDTWFSGFSSADQRRILETFGISVKSFIDQIQVLLIMIGGLALISAAVLIYYLNRSVLQVDKVQKEYLTFCDKLARTGIHKEPARGPLDYAHHIAAVKPDLAPKVFEIISLYIKLRYAEENMPHAVKTLKSLVRHFNPRQEKY